MKYRIVQTPNKMFKVQNWHIGKHEDWWNTLDTTESLNSAEDILKFFLKYPDGVRVIKDISTDEI